MKIPSKNSNILTYVPVFWSEEADTECAAWKVDKLAFFKCNICRLYTGDFSLLCDLQSAGAYVIDMSCWGIFTFISQVVETDTNCMWCLQGRQKVSLRVYEGSYICWLSLSYICFWSLLYMCCICFSFRGGWKDLSHSLGDRFLLYILHALQSIYF